MIASDIHGSAYYCDKMLRAYRNEQADKLLLLGDLLYHGPRNDLPEDYQPKKVTEMLNGMREHILCVRGNCEAEVDQMVLQFPVLADYCILYLGSRMIFASHGHHHNRENPPPLRQGDVLLNGHTHIPHCAPVAACVSMNPGSVAIPKENSPHSYMVMTDGVFEWKDLDGTTYMHYVLT
jgi:putative phosphoesterase